MKQLLHNGLMNAMTGRRARDPRTHAVDVCLAAAEDAGSLALGLRDYERITGISARMLVHHFGNKAGLEAALLERIEARLLDHVVMQQAESASPYDIAKGFAEPDFASLRVLLRLLLGRALSGDQAAAKVLRGERERWRAALLATCGSTRIAEEALFTLVGGAVDAMLGEGAAPE
ncbi:hypothetical protein [Mycolicibacterium arenosum]|uniref:TetR family transcriptional regulator n=1 Tax=Mycolicibacterium arenosum TaxID=2952157 RepID=A0ABT1M723_9MYCO|nr:hypothetical protein [Mycolicibacterium sp. CAU 1645]MCP9274973.1 hypothetical protein [Mycolicibacterium sp. CAU 1645]